MWNFEVGKNYSFGIHLFEPNCYSDPPKKINKNDFYVMCKDNKIRRLRDVCECKLNILESKDDKKDAELIIYRDEPIKFEFEGIFIVDRVCKDKFRWYRLFKKREVLDVVLRCVSNEEINVKEG